MNRAEKRKIEETFWEEVKTSPRVKVRFFARVKQPVHSLATKEDQA